MNNNPPDLIELPPIEYYFSKIQYPVSKQDLLKHAEQNNASAEIMEMLKQFSEREYTSIVDIIREADKFA